MRGLTVIKNLVPKMSLALLCPVAAGSLRKLGNLKIEQNDKLANRGPELMSFWDQSHCKKELAVFPSPAGMSLTKLFLGGNNLIFPAQGEFGQ